MQAPPSFLRWPTSLGAAWELPALPDALSLKRESSIWQETCMLTCDAPLLPHTHTHTHTQVLEVRHGAVVGVSEVLPALEEAGLQLPAELLSKVRACVWLCV